MLRHLAKMVKLSNNDFEFVYEAILQAIAEVKLEPNISQGVEDDLMHAAELLEAAEADDNNDNKEE